MIRCDEWRWLILSYNPVAHCQKLTLLSVLFKCTHSAMCSVSAGVLETIRLLLSKIIYSICDIWLALRNKCSCWNERVDIQHDILFHHCPHYKGHSPRAHGVLYICKYTQQQLAYEDERALYRHPSLWSTSQAVYDLTTHVTNVSYNVIRPWTAVKRFRTARCKVMWLV